jgi:hypothetical protein
MATMMTKERLSFCCNFFIVFVLFPMAPGVRFSTKENRNVYHIFDKMSIWEWTNKANLGTLFL